MPYNALPFSKNFEILQRIACPKTVDSKSQSQTQKSELLSFGRRPRVELGRRAGPRAGPREAPDIITYPDIA
jgi:hypothetical protein